MKKSKKAAKWKIGVSVLLVLFLIVQFIRPEITHPPVTRDIEVPAEVKAILVRTCYDCHSNQIQLRWFDKIAPMYWGVAQHIKEGREGLNFSEWDKLDPASRKAKLWEAVNQVIAGAMPLKDYEFVHRSAKISSGDLKVLKQYLNSMVVKPLEDTAKINALNKQYTQSQSTAMKFENLPRALNGVEFIPDYKNWLPISPSERFDNGTMRVILGNDIAIKAIQDKQVNPWPKGTTFAKVAWDQLEDKEGHIRTGAFKQIEIMIKDEEKYRSTKGWGWARFKTPKMIPYGKDAMFTNECINCHLPQANQDLVFSSPFKH
ncbi:MAG: heme-binding domain-containing protein [Bacteroidetes bacterium]|jgi:hypothetical protein|nr:heme-binding domain-containing protein [Bacteroidota bacterium]